MELRKFAPHVVLSIHGLEGLGSGVSGLGLMVWGLEGVGLIVWGLGFTISVDGSRFEVSGLVWTVEKQKGKNMENKMATGLRWGPASLLLDPKP